MENLKVHNYLKELVKNTPADWLNLTTHRLDIYNESLAKTQFIEEFEKLFASNNSTVASLSQLPTAYDYIRLGHPLSTVLEWAIAKEKNLTPDQVISFSSRTIPLMAILRKNLLDKKKTRVFYTQDLPKYIDAEALRTVYGYDFELKKISSVHDIPAFDGSTVFLSQSTEIAAGLENDHIDFQINIYQDLGSILMVNGDKNLSYIPAIQHVRRRETIAMTPVNCYTALERLLNLNETPAQPENLAEKKEKVLSCISEINGTNNAALIGSSGLSIQYAIMMGLVDFANVEHPGKDIKIIVPPNCYGGTNDQARRIAACFNNAEILDLPVDGPNDMVNSTAKVLELVAQQDAIPFIIAEIPTNPRVEVPDLDKLRAVLSANRHTPNGQEAAEPVFILDQTFCPNVQFVSPQGFLSNIMAISYVSGSKFPSGGKCTAGYCIANDKANGLMSFIDKHLVICDNEATDLQVDILAAQLPSMNQRIADAYINTREFVSFIQETLPEAKINFVSEDLAAMGFTPSVFSLDLPTKGSNAQERENYKRALNDKLITMMISRIPNESKYCVSYGQLKGCYWTIPATSTQGTTKEDDKDYIARVSVSPNLDLELHKKVFLDFVEGI